MPPEHATPDRACLPLVRIPAAEFFQALTRRTEPRIEACLVAERLFMRYARTPSEDYDPSQLECSPPSCHKRHPQAFDQWCQRLYVSHTPQGRRPELLDDAAFVWDMGDAWLAYDEDGQLWYQKDG